MALETSNPRRSRIDDVTTETGQFAILAIDHVGSFATAIRPEDPESFTLAEARDVKRRLIGGLAPHASAVLVDPGYLTHGTRSELGLAEGTGVILGIEDGDYEAVEVEPRLLPGWSVERAAELGVDAVKISFYFDIDGDTSASSQFVAEVVRQCAAVDMPLFAEPLAMVDDPRDRRRHVLEGVRRFSGMGADVLKIQFPEQTGADASRADWAAACQEVDEACEVPWTLLSEGGDFALFSELLGVACRAGASGFLAGRTMWQEAATGRREIEAAAGRLDEIRSIVVAHGAPWNRRNLSIAPGSEDATP